MRKDHDYYMGQALKQAQRAFDSDEVPIGAVVVDEAGIIIARAYNQVERKQTQVAHAEMLAVSKAGAKQGTWRLSGCWLYVTLEPCAMCINLMVLSRLAGVVFGTSSPVFGYQLDKHGIVQLYQNTDFPLTVVEGNRAHESAHLLRTFFRRKRKAGRGAYEES